MSYPAQQFSKTPPRRLSEAELRQRAIAAFPESSGPGVEHESGAVTYGQPGHPRTGRIPHPSGMDHERLWRERAEQEAHRAAVPPEVREARALIEAELRAGRRWA